MQHTGWIKVNRSLLDWEFYKKPNVLTVWMYLLLNANIKPTQYKGVLIDQGCCHATLAEISEATGLSIKQVRTAIGALKGAQQVAQFRRGSFSIISIVSWDKYQNKGHKNGHKNGQSLLYKEKVYYSKPKEEGFAERTGKSRSSSSQKKKVELRDDSEFLG